MIDPSKSFYYYWLCLISFAIVYNLVIVIARAVFWELNNAVLPIWMSLDYFSDLIYALDMVIASRTGKKGYLSV